MKRSELDALRRAAETESPMTRVALHDVANADTVRRQLQKAFDKHVQAHESIDDLVRRIQSVFDLSEARAKTIAVTERTKAANGQRYANAIRDYLQAYDKAVKQHKKRPQMPTFQWINPKTAREPRPHHVAASGTVKEVGKEFLPGLRYPGDPQAPASEVINCHCYIRRKR